MTRTEGVHRGIRWVKTHHADIARGFTTVYAPDAEHTFYGHTSNAQAWSFIDRLTGGTAS